MFDALMGHLVGDYVLQNDFLATQKKNSSLWCAVHCAEWTLCVCLFAGWSDWRAVLLLFVSHFIQDRWNPVSRWMTFNGQTQFRDGPCSPWSAIIVDNIGHLLVIWLIGKMLPVC